MLSRVKANSASTAASKRHAFIPNCLRCIAQVIQTSERQRINPVLAVTDPTALPTAISALPSSAAKTETSISGRVVAKLTTVQPMINLGIPEASAIQAAASTKKSPPLMMQTSPAVNSTSTHNKLLPVKSRPIEKTSLSRFTAQKKTFCTITAVVMC